MLTYVFLIYELRLGACACVRVCGRACVRSIDAQMSELRTERARDGGCWREGVSEVGVYLIA